MPTDTPTRLPSAVGNLADAAAGIGCALFCFVGTAARRWPTLLKANLANGGVNSVPTPLPNRIPAAGIPQPITGESASKRETPGQLPHWLSTRSRSAHRRWCCIIRQHRRHPKKSTVSDFVHLRPRLLALPQQRGHLNRRQTVRRLTLPMIPASALNLSRLQGQNGRRSRFKTGQMSA